MWPLKTTKYVVLDIREIGRLCECKAVSTDCFGRESSPHVKRPVSLSHEERTEEDEESLVG